MNNGDQPAFPLDPGKQPGINAGLTKREQIAAMAMQGILSSGQLVGGKTTYHPDDIAFTATRYADELLKKLDDGNSLQE